MKAFVVVEAATGEPLRQVILSGDDPDELNLTAGEAAVPGAASMGTYWDGAVWVQKPARPAPHSAWDPVDKLWTDPRSLEEARQEKWQEMKKARAAAEGAPLATPFGTFDADPVSTQRIANAVLLTDIAGRQGPPVETEFTLADNTSVTLTPGQMTVVGLMLGAQVQAAHTRGREVRAAIWQTTREDLGSITW